MINKWNINDINFLKENYKLFSNKELELKINRSDNAIRIKLDRLGLIRDVIIPVKNYCITCGKEITKYKKFCNASCAAKTNNKLKPPRSKESRNKTSKIINKYFIENGSSRKLKPKALCFYCGGECKTTYRKYCSSECKNACPIYRKTKSENKKEYIEQFIKQRKNRLQKKQRRLPRIV